MCRHIRRILYYIFQTLIKAFATDVRSVCVVRVCVHACVRAFLLILYVTGKKLPDGSLVLESGRETCT